MSNYQEKMVGIPIADLTNPDFDACSKTGTGFLMTYSGLFRVHFM
jgi:hypothetical protein